MTSLLDHTHGVANTSCSHDDCRAAANRYRKQWELDRSRGHQRLVDADPVRLHIATLVGHGWSYRAISGAAGISAGVPHHIARGQQRVHPGIAEKILAIDPASVPRQPSHQTTEPFVPRVGAVRRIQALMTLGWTHAEMGRRSGVRTAVVLHQQGRWVTRTTHDKVAAMYRALCTQPGPSSRTRGRALRRGYLGPLDWNDIDHDHEPEPIDHASGDDVDEVVVERILGGERVPANHAERLLVFARWPETGRSFAELERLTGWKPERYRQRDGDAA